MKDDMLVVCQQRHRRAAMEAGVWEMTTDARAGWIPHWVRFLLDWHPDADLTEDQHIADEHGELPEDEDPRVFVLQRVLSDPQEKQAMLMEAEMAKGSGLIEEHP